MSWLLDADVLSQPAKSRGDARVVEWLRAERDHCHASSVVVAPLAYWVQSKGKQREALQAWLTRLLEALNGRINGFNVGVALVWADQQHELEAAGLKMPLEDTYIAATARRQGVTIVTGNERHFRRPGVRLSNPFRELG